MELPSSWNLKTKKRPDGRLDIVGKDDSGNPYKVRTTDTAEVSQKDVEELKLADRENYPNREAGVRAFVNHLCPPDKKEAITLNDMTSFDESEWIAAAEPLVHAGLERKGCTIGSTWAYRRGWDRAFGKEN
jgi:hypothetical protein